MRGRRTAMTLGSVGLLAFVLVVVATPVLAQVTTLPGGDTTTLTPTTLAPTTLAPTTLAPTTTAATATTTTEATTSTTLAPAPAATSSDDSKTTRIIVGILLVIAAALITTLVVVRRNAKRDKAEWTNAAASALRDADLTRDMLAGEAQPGAPEEPARVMAVRDNVDRVAADFDRLAANAPGEDMRRNALAVGSSLRGYFFALEAEQMLHDAPTTPTADQLANADSTRRARATELDTAINAIRNYLKPDASV